MTESKNYPLLGTVVKYVRQKHDKQKIEVEVGEGVVVGINLDHRNRVVVFLELDQINPNTGKKDRINVDFACLNPSNEFIEDYTEQIKAIEELAEEGNAKVHKIVNIYNNKTEDIWNNLIGQPVVVAGDKLN
jgi:hypothetical protein